MSSEKIRWSHMWCAVIISYTDNGSLANKLLASECVLVPQGALPGGTQVNHPGKVSKVGSGNWNNPLDINY